MQCKSEPKAIQYRCSKGIETIIIRLRDGTLKISRKSRGKSGARGAVRTSEESISGALIVGMF